MKAPFVWTPNTLKQPAWQAKIWAREKGALGETEKCFFFFQMAKLKTENESVANTFHSFVCVAPPPPPCFIITPLFCETLLTVEKQRVAYMR